MKRVLRILLTSLLVLSMLISLVSCGGTSNTGANKAGDKKKLAALISELPKGVPFTDLTWRGFEKLQKDTGTDIKLVEALDKAEYAEQIRAMAKLGANPIYTMFDSVSEVAIKVAPEFPDTKFFLIDSGLKTDLKNVATIGVDPLEASFMAGFVAAKTTKVNHVAWIGHLDIPVINRFRDGFIAGVKYANPSITVDTAYIGSDNDVVKGRETAKVMISKGADVIFQTANMSGVGVMEACGEAKVKCIGVDDWQGNINSYVFWSALTDIDGAVYLTTKDFQSGKFDKELPRNLDFNLKANGKIFDQRDYDKLPKDLQGEVTNLMNKMKDGSLDINSYLKK